MARRRKKEDLADILIDLPWWISAGLGVAGYIGLRWIVPSTLPPLLRSAGPSIQAMAWVPIAMFGFFSLLSFARSKTQAATPVSVVRGVNGTQRRKLEPVAIQPVDKLDHVWGNASARPVEAAADARSYKLWTLDALRALEWKRFELLCARYYEMTGFRSETLRCGADGGIDVKLFRIDPAKPLAIVQCKAWSGQVGVVPVRELLGVMTSEKVGRGIFLTTSTYTKDAQAFAEANPIQLLDGPGFLKKIQDLSEAARMDLLTFAFDGDYSTPTCASCGVKMVRRESKRGPFWGCVNYPRCKCNLQMKR